MRHVTDFRFIFNDTQCFILAVLIVECMYGSSAGTIAVALSPWHYLRGIISVSRTLAGRTHCAVIFRLVCILHGLGIDFYRFRF